MLSVFLKYFLLDGTAVKAHERNLVLLRSNFKWEEMNMDNENCLKVRMLGDFAMTYYGQPIEMGKNQTTKVMQILQLLLYAGSQGIARTQMMEYLYDSDMEGDRANNLRVNIFYLRRRLEETELPKET